MTAYTPALGSMTHYGFVYDALQSERLAITSYSQFIVCTACKKLMLLNSVYPFVSAMSGRHNCWYVRPVLQALFVLRPAGI